MDSRQSVHRPEILAYHLANAQKPAAAIRWWHEAAIEAKLRSANDEAVADLLNALRLLDQLPNEAERDNQEFLLLIELIAPYRASKGFAAPEVATVTDRAIELADRARDARAILPLLYNQWVYKFVSAHRDVAQSLAEFNSRPLRLRRGRSAAHDRAARARRHRLHPRPLRRSGREFSRQHRALFHGAAGRGHAGARPRRAGRRLRLQQPRLLVPRANGRGARQHRPRARHAEATGHASTMAFAVYHQTLLRGVLERDAEVLRANGRRLEAIGRNNHFKMWMVAGRLLRSMGTASPRRPRRASKRSSAILAISRTWASSIGRPTRPSSRSPG